ncbi:hypothetical protein ABZS94_28830 [Streptomyces sp. NPDC005500]|uniref:hypothetical protein n=1 Tax=Streptomyces sp. NPDC005500 TaxID=3155007 RepID=UPI00339ECE8D
MKGHANTTTDGAKLSEFSRERRSGAMSAAIAAAVVSLAGAPQAAALADTSAEHGIHQEASETSALADGVTGARIDSLDIHENQHNEIIVEFDGPETTHH